MLLQELRTPIQRALTFLKTLPAEYVKYVVHLGYAAIIRVGILFLIAMALDKIVGSIPTWYRDAIKFYIALEVMVIVIRIVETIRSAKSFGTLEQLADSSEQFLIE